MARGFVACDRGQMPLMPPSLSEWLPEDHLVRTILGAVDQMDLERFAEAYRLGAAGRAPYDPRMMVALVLARVLAGAATTVREPTAAKTWLVGEAGRLRHVLRDSASVEAGSRQDPCRTHVAAAGRTRDPQVAGRPSLGPISGSQWFGAAGGSCGVGGPRAWEWRSLKRGAHCGDGAEQRGQWSE